MTRFKIPRSPEAVTDQLGEIGELLTATEWKRAALLASVVRLDPNGGGRNARKPAATGGFHSATSFSELGITGLRSKGTVTLYVQRWLEANDDEYPELGATVVLPEDDWPPTRTGTDGYESATGVERTIDRLIETHGPTVIAQMVTSRPEMAAAMAEDDQTFAPVLHARVERDRRWEEQERDNGVRGGRGSSPLSPVLEAMQKLKMQMGTIVFVGGGKQMYEAILARSREPQPWRPGELEVLNEEIDKGLRYGADSKALLTPVSDEDLAALLSGEGER